VFCTPRKTNSSGITFTGTPINFEEAERFALYKSTRTVNPQMAPTNFSPKATFHRIIGFSKRTRKTINGLRLRARWAIAGFKGNSSIGTSSNGLDAFDIVVINLKQRKDRLDSFAKQMESLEITKWRKIEAIDGRERFPDLKPFFSGSLGCTLSHINALRTSQNTNAVATLVCEDDAEFLLSREELDQIIGEFLSNSKLDVLALYGRARGGAHRISPNLRIAAGIVGRVCYAVKPHMVDTLIARFENGTTSLEEGKRRGKGDLMWQGLQYRKYFFATPTRAAVINSAGYSDIEGRDLGPR